MVVFTYQTIHANEYRKKAKLNTHFLPNNFIIIRIKKILLFITFCFAAVFSNAQQIKNETAGDNYRAVHWTIENGLSVNTVLCMIKDIKRVFMDRQWQWTKQV
jgi:hypothetical protein